MPFSLSASLLTVIHAALERRIDFLEAVLALYTALVALGLLYEYGFDIKAFGKLKPPISKWFPLLVHMGALLVTVGVAGELYVEVMMSGPQGNLRSLNNGLTAVLNKEAGEARQKAGEAEDRAAKAEVRVRELELELTKLKTPRTLSAAQRGRIEVKLGKFQTTPYELASDPDPEALNFVRIVDAVLRSSKWQYMNSSRNDFRSTFTIESGSRVEIEYLSGVAIRLTKGTLVKYKGAAEALRDALKAEGINARLETRGDDDPSPNNVHVVVGTKE